MTQTRPVFGAKLRQATTEKEHAGVFGIWIHANSDIEDDPLYIAYALRINCEDFLEANALSYVFAYIIICHLYP